MCVKTKTGWSCGCYKKALNTCDDAPDSNTPCHNIDKYHYLEEGDCKTCKAGGAKVTRGQDGLGRYGREIAAREKKSKRHSARAVLGEITGNGSQAGSANNGKSTEVPIVTPDPWMKPTRREKKWESPHRRQADEEWEREHARRKEDIEGLWESYSSSPKRQSHSRRIVAAESVQPYEIEDSLIFHHNRRTSGSLQNKGREINHTMERSSRPHQSRHGSVESIESVPSRGRTRTLPVQFHYATDFGYTVENRVPREAYGSAYKSSPISYKRRDW